MSPAKQTCSGKKSNGYWHVPCANAGRLEHEGALFCKIHHPPTIKAKTQAKQAQWAIDAEQHRARYAKEEKDRREQKRRADMFPDLLDALKDALCYGVMGAGWVEEKARTAIAKAEGQP